MSTIEKIQGYIKRTNVKNNARYQLDLAETFDMVRAAQETPIEMICLAFDYGQAKGYRMAKAERKKGRGKAESPTLSKQKAALSEKEESFQGMEVALL